MKAMIYCFSGTGNSLYTARKIAGALGGADVISVRCDPASFSAEEAEVIGFVCPVYEWDVPGAFKDFVARLAINPNAYIFMVATCIAVLGKSFETVAALLEEKGARLHYGRAVRCVASQCIAYPPFPPERIMLPYMDKQLQNVCGEIVSRKQREYPRMSPLTRRRFSRVMEPYLAIENEYDKGFFTDDRCRACGICEKVCPNRNITMESGRPVWNHHCHGCNACVAYCPTKAIQFTVPEAYRELNTVICKMLRLPEGRKRYHHPQVKAGDLMADRTEIKP